MDTSKDSDTLKPRDICIFQCSFCERHTERKTSRKDTWNENGHKQILGHFKTKRYLYFSMLFL